MFDERADPGKVSSYLLAAAVHLILFAVLVFGVRWQNRPPESIAVELWEPPPPPPAVQIQPEPKPAPLPEPAPVIVKPEPPIPKPEIVEKAPPPKPKPAPRMEPKPKPVAKAEPKLPPKPVPAPRPLPRDEQKPVPRVEPLKPRVDDTQRRMREELAREQASFAVDRERQRVRDQLASDANSARDKLIADWVNKVKSKIRGNVILPTEFKGNPEAILDVVQLPTGEVITAKVRKSSGSSALDAAIERAILKSSPLPRPDRGESAPRAFELKYRPLD
ncbi:MAG: TonB C-terminal domain-containing protein [Candidatus Parcubacteria bacterium]|nr:TonB C-terminal domain-containing protein [Burkholderiales bacterium]